MKNQIKQRLQMVLLAAIFLLGAFGSTFAQGIGAKYGSRDPRPCKKTAAAGKVPTAAEAAASVICNGEHERGNESLFLLEDVKVTQIGKGSPYKPGVDFNVDNLDPKFLIYPIRGSLKKYQCGKPNASDGGKSCWLYDEQNAEGKCYKDTFGEWQCSMSDKTLRVFDYTEVAPPGGATAAAAKDKPAAPKDNKQPAATKDDAVENRDENGFPKPDFSALEKWYQIIRYEYKPIEKKLYIYFKTDVAYRERPTEFKMEFRNKDGMLMQYTEVSWMGGFSDAEVGEPTKGYVTMPRESVMKEVVTAKAVRVVE